MLSLLLAAFAFTSAQAYETCTEENNYMEHLLPAPVQLDPTKRVAIPETCVETAHKTLAPTGYYGFCPTPIGKPERDHVRPCVSEAYVKVIHSTLLDVTDCLGWDAKLAFSSFNLESAMHLNAVGRATDVGIGQLTKSAIDEVNLNALERARRMAGKSLKPSCARILPGMTGHSGAIEERCGFMSLPENPVRNVVFSVLLLQQLKRNVSNLWKRFEIQMPPDVNTDRLQTLLTMLAYNAGPGGILSTLKAYVDQMQVPLTDHHFNFESTEEDSFRTYVLNNFPNADEAVRKRVSKYIGYIMTSARRVDGLAGGTGMCLPDYFAPTLRLRSSGPAPDRLQARRLVEENMRAIEKGLSGHAHDFMFKDTYLAR